MSKYYNPREDYPFSKCKTKNKLFRHIVRFCEMGALFTMLSKTSHQLRNGLIKQRASDDIVLFTHKKCVEYNNDLLYYLRGIEYIEKIMTLEVKNQ